MNVWAMLILCKQWLLSLMRFSRMLSSLALTEARFPLPELTARVDG